MLMVISPAKTLDFETKAVTGLKSESEFLGQSEYLIKKLKKLSSNKISDLMSISSNLAELNRDRFNSWELPFTEANAKQAVLAFKGDVYTGMDAEDFSKNDFEFAQNHLRILSGLYGVLKPLDLIQPYRLEMGTKFNVTATKTNLYKYWDSSLRNYIEKELEMFENPVLVNLASNEYFKAVQAKKLKCRIITPIFKDESKGQYKVISFLAKKARGMMCRYAIKNRITDVEALREFNFGGYLFNPEVSDADNWVFYGPQR